MATVGSGAAYDFGYSYQNNGGNVNITGSPDWGGRVVLLDGLGSGCSDNQFAQFNATAIQCAELRQRGHGVRPQLPARLSEQECRHVGGAENSRLGSEKYRLELRADVFNATNTVDINGRNTSAQFTNPTSMTLVNNQFNADGSLNQSRLTPRNAGFGAATGAQTMRNIQLQLRFQF